MKFSKEIRKRFWSKIDKISSPDGCWLWTACTNGRYGLFSWLKGCSRYVHRISWMISFGKVPKGMCVCHKCDNPLCVNPSHLWLGTQIDNLKDMDAKDRRSKGKKHRVPRGKNHHRSVLTNKQRYKVIPRLVSKGLSDYDIADILGVTRNTVYGVMYATGLTKTKGTRPRGTK